ncbi:MAG: TGS domain-containing protein, partial [Nitrospinota bacterium]
VDEKGHKQCPHADEKLREGMAEREAYLAEAKKRVEEALAQAGIQGAVSARFKLHSSIYRKMQVQNLDFHQVYDICGLRVIVNELKDCYAVLGLLHSLWRPIPGRFKDYVALPKANLYQSLHTTLMGPGGQRVEFQIRTKEMHRLAEEGIAAHWRYKEGEKVEEGVADKFEWLRRIMESLQEETDPRNLVDAVRLNLFEDEVFVFTPRGEVRNFPRGATPVDFAYAIHTEVGHHCVGAKVNGRIAPLSSRLENGDIVEILTNPHRTPAADWLKFVVSARAKQKIRAWIRQSQRDRSITLGRELLDHELARLGVKPAAYLKPEALKEAALALGVPSEEDLLAIVGFGRLSARHVLGKLLPEDVLRQTEKRERSPLRRLVAKVSGKLRPSIKVKGQDDILIRFGKCCDPIPGDPIVGFITRGKGVTVHAESCANVRGLMSERERLVDVSWGELRKEELYVVSLIVDAMNRPGVLAGLSTAIASCQSNIVRVSAETSRAKAGIQLDVQVSGLEHLKEVIQKVRGVKGIISVARTGPSEARDGARERAEGD